MRYLVRERIFSIKADFWITDEAGNEVFKVDGKALSLRQTFELKDASGRNLAVIHKKFFSVRDAMEIEHDGAVAAVVRRALFSPVEHRFHIERPGAGHMEAVGNFFDKEFEIRDGGRVAARISRQWFRIRDTYGVDVAPGENDALILAIAVCIDRIHHDEEEQHHR